MTLLEFVVFVVTVAASFVALSFVDRFARRSERRVPRSRSSLSMRDLGVRIQKWTRDFAELLLTSGAIRWK